MMKNYAVYSTRKPSAERDALLALYPNAAIYGDYYVFNGTFESLTGGTPALSDDYSDIEITDTPEKPNQRKRADFVNWARSEMAKTHTGKQVVFNKQCAQLLVEEIFSEVGGL